MLVRSLLVVIVPMLCFAEMNTPEDLRHLRAFDHLHANHTPLKQNMIPKKIHFIWLGVDEIPNQMKEAMEGWVSAHPHWNCYLWSDYHHAVEGLKSCSVEMLHGSLPSLYYRVSNVAERSILLRYTILNKYGGIYLDGDVECKEAVDALIRGADFVTAQDVNPTPFLSSRIYATPYFIAAKPQHEIITNALREMIDRWSTVDESFPGRDDESMIYKASYHTFIPLTKAVLSHAGRNDKVISTQEFAQYGHHLGLRSWLKEKKAFEEVVAKEINECSAKMKRELRFIYFLTGTICFSGLLLIFRPKRVR